MEKKKLKLSISGSSKKTINSIEQAKSQSKNTVVIEKRPRFGTKPNYSRPNTSNERPKGSAPFVPRNNTFSKPTTSPSSDFERRKIAEQRATRRLKGETTPSKDSKAGKGAAKRRELKLTVSRALSDEDFIGKGRSLASLKRAKQKENRLLNQEDDKDSLKPVKRDVKIPEVVTIRELANRMAEQSSNIIKHLLGMGVTVTINHTIDSDTAEYLVKDLDIIQ